MKTVTTREAQHHLSKVIAEAEPGEEVSITRRGEEVAILRKADGSDSDSGGGRILDWSEALNELNDLRDTLPQFDNSIVEIMRQKEKY